MNTPNPADNDAEIIAQSIEQPHVFATLFDRYALRIHRYVARRIGSEGAYDVVSQTFLAAFENRPRYDLAFPSAKPWLFGIATNVMRQHRRTEVRAWRAMAASTHEVEPSFVDDAVDRVDSRSHSTVMAGVLAELSDGDREVLLLFAWEDFTYAEIGAALAIPVGTVRSRLHRARTQLRASLGPYVLEEIS